ncbi:MAG: M64 family metallopeptidase [Betaproteobacteria bacterium]
MKTDRGSPGKWHWPHTFASTIALIGWLSMPSLAIAETVHYFVVKEALDGSLSIVSHQLVSVSGALTSNTSAILPGRLESQLTANVRDKTTGTTLLDAVATTSPWLRGEFHGDPEIDGHHLPVDERLYVIRAPIKNGSVMRLSGFRGTSLDPIPSQVPGNGAVTRSAAAALEIDLDAYTVEPLKAYGAAGAIPPPLPPGASTGNLYLTGNPANRLDLLIVGEGYTAAQQALFIQHATTMIDGFLSISPYSDFRHLVNVAWLFVPSNQSGADKPACAETPASPVVSVDTAFDATFCSSGIRRLVTINTSKVLTAAAGVPDWDKILVLVNDGEYGGSGGSISVATTNPSSTGIMQHEFGHSFSLLADEYTTAFPGYPACSDLTVVKTCEPNVSNQTDRNLLKWTGWVAAATSIPTPGALADPIAAGLWEGARYFTTGMYRQCFNGIMRNLGRPFCHIDGEAFVKRLYGGGWGAPSQGVKFIEPGALPSVASVNAPDQTNVIFQASLAGSLAASGLTATWLVDGNVIQVDPSAHGAQVGFSYLVPDAATHSVELRVSDSTPLVLVTPIRSQNWTVTGVSAGSCVYAQDAATGTVGVTATAGCYWSAVSNDNWIGVTAGASATGTGSVGYSVPANTGPGARTGTLSIAGQTFTITQVAGRVPDAPVIGSAGPGDTQAFVYFTAPASIGSTPISGYTATCNPAGASASGLTAPIIVTGLGNGISQSCSVTATNASGTGAASATAGVTPSASAPPALLSVKSRKTHGGEGPFDVPIDLTQSISLQVTVEPRGIGSGHTLVWQFSGSIGSPGSAGITPIGMATATSSANEIFVTLTNVPDEQRVTVTLQNVNGTLNPPPVSMGFLVGDVNNTRSVNASDISGLKARSAQTASAANFRFDLNASGAVNQFDISAAKARSGRVLP